MKTIKIYCKECNVKLTDELEEVVECSLKNEDGESLIDYKKFCIINVNEKVKEVAVALDDYYLLNHKDSSRFNGCCGCNGSDGLNKTCINGHEVATEFSDCYMPHYISFDIDKILIKEKKDDYNYVKVKL